MKVKFMRGLLTAAVTLSLLTGGVGGSETYAQQSGEPIRIRIGGPHTPQGAAWVKLMQDIFIRDVKAAAAKAGHNVEFVEAWGGSVTKMTETSNTVQGRLLDVSYVTFPAEVSRFPLHNFPYWLPFGNGDAVITYRATKAVYDEFPVLTQSVEQKYGQKLLGISTVQDYGILTSFPVQSLDDLKGRKVGGVGPVADYLRSAGAVPVATGIPEMYMNIQTRVMDGMVIIPQAIVGLRMWEVAKHWTVTQFGSISPHGLTVNLDTWKALPPAIQSAMAQAGIAWGDALAKNAKDTEKTDLEKWREAGGTVTVLPPAERQKWASRFPANHVSERAKKVDAAGLPGTKVIASYIRNLEKLGYQAPRKWELEGK
jgi:TRAP-type C4-dicarboxylate transport system substrate-binding protein